MEEQFELVYCRDVLLSFTYHGDTITDVPKKVEEYLIQSIRTNLVRLEIVPIEIANERRTCTHIKVTYLTASMNLPPKVAYQKAQPDYVI